MVFLVILCVILYFLIFWNIFKFISKRDWFEEYETYDGYKFPTYTFNFSLFWVITIPIGVIIIGLEWLFDGITTWGYAYSEMAKEKKGKEK